MNRPGPNNRGMCGLVLAAILSWSVGNAVPSQPVDPVRPPLQIEARLVPVPVAVVNKDGEPVAGLTAGDFQVWDNDAPRSIIYFRAETLKPELAAATVPLTLARTATAESAPASRRIFLIVLGRGGIHDPFDTTTALIQFIRKRLLPQDRLAIMAYNRATDFTTDHDRLIEVLERYRAYRPNIELQYWKQARGNSLAALYGARLTEKIQCDIDRIFGLNGRPLATTVGSPELTIAGSSQRQPGEGLAPLIDFNALLADPTLGPTAGAGNAGGHLMLADPFDLQQFRALTGLPFDAFLEASRLAELDVHSLFAGISYLRYLPGAKYLIYFSDHGLYSYRAEVERQLVALANDAQVSIYSYQTGGVGRYSSVEQDRLFSTRMDSDNIQALTNLRLLAELTGGRASIHDNVAVALEQMDAITRTGYWLGYDPGPIAWDGRYHRIRVAVARPHMIPLHRKGYYATPNRESVDRESFIAWTRIAVAQARGREIQDVRFTLAPDHTRPDDSTTRWVRLKIDPRTLGLVRIQNQMTGRVYVAVFYGPSDNPTAPHTWNRIDIRLDEADVQRALAEGVGISVRISRTARSVIQAAVYAVGNDLVGLNTLAN